MTRTPLNAVTVAEYLATPAPTPDWLVEGVLPGSGLVCLLARPKTGKSILAAQLMQALTTGEPFLAKRVVHKRRCLYVQLDCTPGDWHKQLDQLDGGAWRWRTLDLGQVPRYLLDDSAERQRLKTYITAQGFDFVVWDSLEKLTKLDLNPVEGMRLALDRLADIWGGSRLLIHHPRKPSGDAVDRPADAGAGNHYLGAESSGLWLLSKTKPLEGTLAVEGRYMDKKFPLIREPETYLWLPASERAPGTRSAPVLAWDAPR